MYRNASPSCTSGQALDRVSEILRDNFHLDAVLMNDITTVSGGFFSGSRECSTEITAIRGSVNASALPWQQLRYRIVHQDKRQGFDVTVELGGRVPLAQPEPSFWERLRARL
jgi:hypothetical protein